MSTWLLDRVEDAVRLESRGAMKAFLQLFEGTGPPFFPAI